jgi:D-arabinose 1-dehydrogenase-like Zn-dependent alcohol dehydrogenase
MEGLTGIPNRMKGLQIREFKKPYYYSEDIPVPNIVHDHDVLIKVAVAGYCHTEMMVQNGDFESKMGSHNKLPLIPSHEGTGIVVAVGSQVSNVKVTQSCILAALTLNCSRCAGRGPRRKYSIKRPLRKLF